MLHVSKVKTFLVSLDIGQDNALEISAVKRNIVPMIFLQNLMEVIGLRILLHTADR